MRFSNNHPSDQVPDDELVSGFRVAQIYIGVAITLPAFLVASEVFTGLGLIKGSIALAISAAILFVVASLTMSVGSKTRLSTYAIIQNVFGQYTAQLINFLLAITLLGWFAVTVSLFSQALNGSMLELAVVTMPSWLTKLLGGGLMTYLTLYGFKAIDGLSRLVVPALTIVLITSFYLILRSHNFEELVNYSNSTGPISTIGVGVSILVGAFMVAITITPDMARFAKSQRDGIAASFLSYGTGSQLILLLAGVPVLVTGSKEFVDNLSLIGFGWPALFVVIFATLTTNINNLYSVSLSLSQIFPKAKDQNVTLISGICGTAIALLGIENAFVPFLMFLSVAIPPIAGIYVVDHFIGINLREKLNRRHRYISAAIGWGVGSLAAFLTSQGLFILTSAPAMDALVVAAISYRIGFSVVARFGGSLENTE